MSESHTRHNKNIASHVRRFIREHIPDIFGEGRSREGERTEDATLPDPDPDFSGIDIEVVWDVLANGRRRRAIRLLDCHGGTWTIRELGNEIAREEFDLDATSDVPPTESQRLHVALLQSHLSLLERGRAVATDDDGRLSAGENLDDFAALLRVAEDVDWISDTDTIAESRRRHSEAAGEQEETNDHADGDTRDESAGAAEP